MEDLDLKAQREKYAKKTEREKLILWAVIICLIVFIGIPTIGQVFVIQAATSNLKHSEPSWNQIFKWKATTEETMFHHAICGFVPFRMHLQGQATNEALAQNQANRAKRAFEDALKAAGATMGAVSKRQNKLAKLQNPYNPSTLYEYDYDIIIETKPLNVAYPVMKRLAGKGYKVYMAALSPRQLCK